MVLKKTVAGLNGKLYLEALFKSSSSHFQTFEVDLGIESQKISNWCKL